MNVPFAFKDLKKNTSKSSIENVSLENDICLSVVNNGEGQPQVVVQTVDQGVIQFFFCCEGNAEFQFGPAYSQELDQSNVMLLYNPNGAMPHHIVLAPKTKMLFLFLSVERLHQLFLDASNELFFLDNENINKKYYTKSEMSTMLQLSVNQLFNIKLSPLSNHLFLKGKAYELLSLYFNREESEDGLKNCPFLEDKTNVDKIRMSKKILINRMTSPPSMKELAREIGLNEYQLKVGFKNIYGATVFGYLNDYKMDHSRNMLDSGDYKVNEVAYALGYTNPSHYIAAFKKKYGITPKKYLMSQKTA